MTPRRALTAIETTEDVFTPDGDAVTIDAIDMWDGSWKAHTNKGRMLLGDLTAREDLNLRAADSGCSAHGRHPHEGRRCLDCPTCRAHITENWHGTKPANN